MHVVETMAWKGVCCDRFQIKKKQFFQNFVAIMHFGMVGVFISFAIILASMYYPIKLFIFLLDDTSPF
jgi:hypothetical protein